MLRQHQNPHLQAFLNFLQFEKRFSVHTITAYGDDLTQFFDFLQITYSNIELAAIKPTYIRSWLATLKDAKLSAKSINRKISSLKSFFKYQLRLGLIENTPMANISSPKINKRLPEFVKQDDIKILLNQDFFPDTWKGKTHHLLISIFYLTGIRLSELINFKESQLNVAGLNIKVLGKGNKERIIPINKQLALQMQQYAAEKRKLFEKFDQDFFLVNEKGKKLYPKYAYNVVKTHLSAVTTIDKKSPHVLRHSFATHLTNEGAELNAIKELLGHSSLAATQVYTHNSIEKLKAAYKKAHPKA